MRKDSILALLVCVNLILAVGIALSSYTLPEAIAQDLGLAGDYMIVAGEIQDSHDALYILDVDSQMLHVLYYERGQRRLRYGASRSLETDFRN